MKKLYCLIAVIIGVSSINAKTKLTSKNINQVISAMTLEEKASLLVGYTKGYNPHGKATAKEGDPDPYVPGASGMTHGNEKYGIPYTVFTDGPAGVNIDVDRKGDSHKYYASGFMTGPCVASSWNTSLVYELGRIMGNETLAFGSDLQLAPAFNIIRNPLCGRNYEYYSEDPFVGGYIAAAMVKGIQSNGVGTSVKHFVANNQETNRREVNVVISQRALREIYLKGFEIAVKTSNPWSVMSSYNKVNGEYTQESRGLLTSILREDWGYKGIVMTDWTIKRNSVAQIHSGNNLLMPGCQPQIDEIVDAVNKGQLPLAEVDAAVKGVLEYIIKTPHFKCYKYNSSPDVEIHAKILRNAAPEGFVLLKNDNNTLPVVNKNSKMVLLGKSSYQLVSGGSGSGNVNNGKMKTLYETMGEAGYILKPDVKEMYDKYNDYAVAEQKVYMGGMYKLSFFPKPRIMEADLESGAYDNLASNNDVAIITLGRKSGESEDRPFRDFEIDPSERNLIKNTCDAFHSKGKKVIVILNVCSSIETASWKDLPDAILCVWTPGQEAAGAIADVLSGKNYPSGKLTTTWPVKLTDMSSTKNFPKDITILKTRRMTPEQCDSTPSYNQVKYDEGIYVGYRYFKTQNIPTSYPFGYGLSYTTFKYSNEKITKHDNQYIATVTVTNTGDQNGKEIVELYVTAPKGKLDKPSCELKAFAKTKELRPGESQKLIMSFSNYDIASFDELKSTFVTDQGTYKVLFGSSVDDIKAELPFQSKSYIWKVNNVLKPSKNEK